MTLAFGATLFCTAGFWPGIAAAQSLSTASDGNQQRLIVTPSVRSAYDTNVLRQNDEGNEPRDNFRVTTGVDIIARRTFGRTAVNVAGTLGYDFNSRYKFLDRTRIEVGGGLRTPVGAICSVSVDARYDQYQFDLGDVDEIIASTTRQQFYDVLASCNRSSGFSPLAGLSYSKRSTQAQNVFGSTTLGERVGISYAKPSLGVISLIGSHSRIRRPGVEDLLGAEDGTEVTQLQLSLNRNVSPRLSFVAGGGYVRANPDRAAVETFSGASFNGAVTWAPVPRLVIDAVAKRDITSQNGINATYVIREDYSVGASWRASQRSRVRMSATRIDRDFAGRGTLPLATVIGEDSTNIITAAYTYDTARIFRFGLSISKRWRDADVARYDYKSTVIGASVGAKF
ncbi:outer membrane beta-barrel protein [Sphingomonas qilianensis]|uniref:Outer membrane beta-barrel protein n=1 Tax=Sphingomonas qilianensis TaxID=1736690 RepID=A0ABU9XPT9_9SPHN